MGVRTEVEWTGETRVRTGKEMEEGWDWGLGKHRCRMQSEDEARTDMRGQGRGGDQGWWMGIGQREGCGSDGSGSSQGDEDGGQKGMDTKMGMGEHRDGGCGIGLDRQG